MSTNSLPKKAGRFLLVAIIGGVAVAVGVAGAVATVVMGVVFLWGG